MENKVEMEVQEVRAVWEAPMVTEYDAKAEILGARALANGEAVFNS